MPARVDKVFNFQSIWSKSMTFPSSDPVLIRQQMQSKYAWEFLQIKTASVRYVKDNEWSEITYEDKRYANFLFKNIQKLQVTGLRIKDLYS